eukprot:2227962-Amphidinium_carterae.2
MSFNVPGFIYSLDVSIAHTFVQIGFPLKEWVKQYPSSIHVPMNQEFKTAVENFPVIRIQETRGAGSSDIANAVMLEDGSPPK